MIIQKINISLLKNDNPVSVGIIDSGFSKIPSYATIYGINSNPNHQHGNRILSIFSSLDKQYPIPNLKLHLSCYNPKEGYDGLIKSLQLLPQLDILSLSLLWKDDDYELKRLLFSKAKKICVPYAKENTGLYYPAYYQGVITCDNNINQKATYSINPVPDYKGNSYAVPAISRLLAYNIELKNDDNGIDIHTLFNNYNDPFIKAKNLTVNQDFQPRCKSCHRYLRDKNHFLVTQLPKKCPYCGAYLK